MPKLGLRLPIKEDARTIQFSTILNVPALPPLLDSFDIDTSLNAKIVESMLGNDYWGDCVIAGRANMSWRFEYFSQKKQVPITTNDCLREYWIEQGANPKYSWAWGFLSLFHLLPDNGLNMIDSLNHWRQDGWSFAGNNYKIYAYAGLTVGNNSAFPNDPEVLKLCQKYDNLMKYCIQLLNGCYVSFLCPQSAFDQWKKGQMWTLDKTSKPRGGHCVWMGGFDSVGPWCYTWGTKQKMTWEFWHYYCMQAFGIIDNVDNWLPSDPINVPYLKQLLDAITS